MSKQWGHGYWQGFYTARLQDRRIIPRWRYLTTVWQWDLRRYWLWKCNWFRVSSDGSGYVMSLAGFVFYLDYETQKEEQTATA